MKSESIKTSATGSADVKVIAGGGVNISVGWVKGGSLDSHVAGLDALNLKNFGANKNGYKTSQVGFSSLTKGMKVGASAMYSIGRTWVY
ncbi:hypothetical protein [Pedobacter nototheniae]|uniref:hypothetical protein n=1 Tax=Pedobacter nototheniae TaxID=2488994 RepID=UPI00103B17A6|nr:hypothetical protein [Pedobacter nototheniae]